MKFYHDPATNVVAIKPTGPQIQMVSVQLPVPAAVALLNHFRRVNNTYQVKRSAAVDALQAALEEVLRSEESTQRLDPAFAGPAEEESFPIRAVFPDYRQPLMDFERRAGVIDPSEERRGD